MIKYVIRDIVRKIVPESVYPVMVKAWGKYRAFYYAGDNVECCLCNGHFKYFLPWGKNFSVLKKKKVVSAGYRENVICPKCYCSNRERHLYLYLQEYSLVFKGQKLKVLHIAPEKKLQHVFKASENLVYLSADLDSPIAMIKMDIQQIQFEDNTFDMIICNHVLEHVPDDLKAIREFFRVLKPGGKVFIEIPVSLKLNHTEEEPTLELPEERIKKFGQEDHVRIYGKDFSSRLCSPGFKVEEYSFSIDKGLAAAKRFGIDPKEKIYIGEK